MMRYLSVCSGIESASVAWEPLGWKAAAFSEIDPFACRLLAKRFPDVPNLGDMTKFKEWPDEIGEGPIDLLVGGTPCQGFSIAGLRAGLADPRSNLALVYLAIAELYRPRWICWENVPGVLSSWTPTESTDDIQPGCSREVVETSDFGCFLEALRLIGYCISYRILDAQYICVDGFPRAVPQRRERVFVIGYLGVDWRRSAAVLLESAGMSGHPAPRRQAGERVSGSLASRASSGGGLGTDLDCDGGLIVSPPTTGSLNTSIGRGTGQGHEDDFLIVSHDPAMTLTAREYKGALPEADLSTVVAEKVSASLMSSNDQSTGRETILIAIKGAAIGRQPHNGPQRGEFADDGSCFTLLANETHAVAFNTRQTPVSGQATGAVDQRGPQGVALQWGVRRLTPTECERLMGFPDGFTDIGGKGNKPTPDSSRYKCLGNSIAVNVLRYIGTRIAMIDAIP